MSVNLWEATNYDFYTNSLATGIASNSTIIYLPSGASGLVAPGVIAIDLYSDAGGALTTTLREFVSFTTVTTGQDQISGLTRGIGGSTGLAHNIGALVYGGITNTHWTDLVDFLQTGHDASGKHVIGTATIAYTEDIQMAVTSTASIAKAYIDTIPATTALMSLVTVFAINVSGASLVGFPAPNPGGLPIMYVAGGLATGTNLTPYLIVEDAVTLKSVSATLRSPVSSASLIIDINNNGTSIFDTATQPSILTGGTYVSTASIKNPSLVSGNLISLDIDTNPGSSVDLSVLLES
jgi:hypothetical protein